MADPTEPYVDIEDLERYFDRTVDIVLWNSQHDRDNGNGARSYVSDANLTRADEHGWEFLATAPDDCGIAFNAREVEEIEESDGVNPTIHIRIVR